MNPEVPIPASPVAPSGVVPVPVPASSPTNLPEIAPLPAFPSDFTLKITDGFQDAFFERRFRSERMQETITDLARRGILNFLSQATHVDEYYHLAAPQADLKAGEYRIRNEGAPDPLLTMKTHGDGISSLSQTVDVIQPLESLLETIRTHGTLMAVIEKDRTTYRLRAHPDCLVNIDSVQSLGKFVDLKADSAHSMQALLEVLKPRPEDAICQSYLSMKTERGISPLQLRAWQFHERFKDYVMGVVSGTLTPLGFLCSTLAYTDKKAPMIIALLTAGIGDGLSDSVASSQTAQSDSRADSLTQIRMFAKTMAGKCAVPCTFIPIVLLAPTNLTIGVAVAAYGAAILSATAGVQALANERPVANAIGRILAWGGVATAAGLGVGAFGSLLEKAFLPLLETLK